MAALFQLQWCTAFSITSIVVLALMLPRFGLAQDNNAGSFCSGPRTPGELRSKLLTGYDPFTRPGVVKAFLNNTASDITVPPDVARIQLHVLSLNGIDQKRNEYELSVWFRRSWTDFRLQYTPKSQGGCFADDDRVGFSEDLVKDIWAPDFNIENQAKPGSQLAGFVQIYPNGKVVQVSQLNLVLACKMKFGDFPRDVQTCGFRVGTFLEDARAVTLGFFEDLPPVTLAEVSLTRGSLPRGGTAEWTIDDARGVIVAQASGATQVESAVEIQFDFARNPEYYSAFVIVPTFMFVMIGWFSFFIDRRAAPARVAMSMIGFLANANFLASQLGQLPRLGNGVWLLDFLSVSQWFTFYSIFEYVICNWLRRIEDRIDGGRKKAQEEVLSLIKVVKKKKRKNSKKKYKYDEELAEEAPAEKVSVTKTDLIAAGFNFKVDLLLMREDTTMYLKDEHVDFFSRYVYPIVYLIVFVVMWWS